MKTMLLEALAAPKAKIGRTLRAYRRVIDARWGVDFIYEVKERLPALKVATIFDVGANIGMTALQFSDAFPKADVHAFEPSAENIRQLNENLIGKPDIHRHQIAFGDKTGQVGLHYDTAHPTMTRIANGSGQATETVPIDTIDNFCSQRNIPQIDILKIDTEGYELPVLMGAKNMLAKGAISAIKAECAVDPDSNFHADFSAICGVLHPFGYRLFGIYDQWEDTLSPTARLRRFDAAFISRSLY